jgi:hypothetical protein
LQELVGNANAEVAQAHLKAQQVLLHGVHKRAFDVEYISAKQHTASAAGTRNGSLLS